LPHIFKVASLDFKFFFKANFEEFPEVYTLFLKENTEAKE